MAHYEERPAEASSWGGCLLLVVLLVLASAGGIVAIDGKPIENGEQLRSALQQYQVGDTATLTMLSEAQ